MDPVVIRGGDLLLEGFGTQLPDIMDEPFIESLKIGYPKSSDIFTFSLLYRP